MQLLSPRPQVGAALVEDAAASISIWRWRRMRVEGTHGNIDLGGDGCGGPADSGGVWRAAGDADGERRCCRGGVLPATVFGGRAGGGAVRQREQRRRRVGGGADARGRGRCGYGGAAGSRG